MNELIISYFLFIFLNLNLYANYSTATERLCVNPTCTEPISIATGNVPYIADAANRLSFPRGKEIKIISKSNTDKDYWGAIIDGKIGYIPANLVRETKVFHSTSKLIPVSNIYEKSDSLKTVQELPANSYLGESIQSNENKNNPPDSVKLDTVFQSLQTSETINIVKNEAIKENFIEKYPADENPSDQILSSKSYNVIEGTTVFEDLVNEIAPSTTYDAKQNSQTLLPGAEQESLNFNNSLEYKGSVQAENPSTLNSPAENQIKAEFTESFLMREKNEKVGVSSNISDATNRGTDQNKNDGAVDDDDDEEEEEESDDEEDGEPDAVVEYDDENDVDEDDELSYPIESENEINQESVKDEVNKSETIKKELVNDNDKNDQKNLVANDSTSSVIEANNPVSPEAISADSESSNLITENSQENVKPIQTDVASEVNKSHSQPDTNSNFIENASENLANDSFTDLNEAGAIENEIVAKTIQYIEPTQAAMGVSPMTVPKENPTENVFNEDSQIPNIQKIPEDDFVQHDFTMETYPMEGNQKSSEQANLAHEYSVKNAEPKVFNQMSDIGEFETKQAISAGEGGDSGKAVSGADPVIKTETGQPYNEAEEPLFQETESLEANSVERAPEEINFFTQGYNLITSMFNSKTDGVDDNNEEFLEKSDTSLNVGESRSNQETVKPNIEENANILGDSSESQATWADEMVENSEDSNFWLPTSGTTFIYLVITAITVLAFTLGHNFIEKKGKSAPLIAKINKLEHELLVRSKESMLLEDEIQRAKEKITLYENSSNDKLILSLQTELEEAKKARSELESSVEVLQQELDSATEAGLDLNKMLSEVLTQKEGSETLLESVENLQAQLNSQQEVIDEMTKKLGIKNEENVALQNTLDAASERADNLEEKLNDMTEKHDSLQREKEELVKELNSQIDKLQVRVSQLEDSKGKEISKFKKTVEELRGKVKETSEALAVKEEECKTIKSAVKQLKAKGNVDLNSLFDACKVKAELSKADENNKSLQEELREEKKSKAALEDRIKALELQVQEVETKYGDAKQKEDEAQKKLEVLSTYFKEKETQLQKELGLQEALWAQKKGDEKAVYNMMKSLQEEVESYKSQNEILKKEILDQERQLKSQMAVLEQKAHENWVAARQAERKLEESRQETSQLRNRLTLVEKTSAVADEEGKLNHRTDEMNGVEAASPILHDTSSPLLFPPLDPNNSSLLPPHGFMPHPMFMPPPVAGFLPPPPPFLPRDRRPPPLGRMSSPPLSSQFSPPPPPPPDYSFERLSSPSLSPHSRSYRSQHEPDREREYFAQRSPPFPPMPPGPWEENREVPGFIPISSQRDSKRERKGSNVNSRHSSSDSLDQSSRHSGRV